MLNYSMKATIIVWWVLLKIGSIVNYVASGSFDLPQLALNTIATNNVAG